MLTRLRKIIETIVIPISLVGISLTGVSFAATVPAVTVLTPPVASGLASPLCAN